MVKLLDNSARHGICRWLPCRFTLTSGLDSADPDDSRQHSDSCDFKNGIPLSKRRRGLLVPSLAAYGRLGSGKHKSRGRRRDIKPGLQPSCPRCPPDEDEAWAGRAAANGCSRPVTRRSQGQLGPKKQHKRARRRGVQPVAVVGFWASQTSPSRLCQHSTACRHSIRSEGIVTSELTPAAVQEDFPNPRAPARASPPWIRDWHGERGM